jgi:hypothetical protein
MQDATHANAAGAGEKKSLKARAVSELQKYAVVSAYLWLLFSLFALHKQIVLGQEISLWRQGFAIINALVFGKVVLIGDALELAKGKDGQSLAGIVLRKSFAFALVLVAFHVAEEMVRAWFKGQALAGVVPELGGVAALAAYAAIFFVVLAPFFAFQEAARVLGSDAMWSLFFRPSASAATPAG